MRVAHRNVTATDFFTGKIYWAEYRPGTLGGSTPQPSVIPPILDDWDQVTTGTSVTFGGSPVLLLWLVRSRGRTWRTSIIRRVARRC